MNKEIKNRWVAALRSGKYKQGREQLRKDDKFCCLGVLCDISGKGEWNGSSYKVGQNSNDMYLTQDLNNEFQITIRGTLDLIDKDNKEVTLSGLNDEGFTFDQIADLIEYDL